MIMGNYEQAFILLITGMSTVFIILMIVVLIGRVSISILNRFPEKVLVLPKNTIGVLTQKKMVALTVAVNIATQGQAKVVKIERI